MERTGYASNAVNDTVDQLLANGVVATGIVVGRILFSCDHLLGVEQSSVGASADFVDDVGFEVAVDGSWNILAVSYTTG